MNKKFVRTKDKRIAGVCGGIAKYFNIDPLIVRVLFLAMMFLGGSGLFIYIVLLIIMPYEDDEFADYVEINSDDASKESPYSEKKNTTEVKKRFLNVSSLIMGLLLILLGIFFLLRNFFPLLKFEYWFPLLLVVGGLLLIITAVKREKK